MINDGEAGISCDNCWFEIVITSRESILWLESQLEFTKNGDPICPGCGDSVLYEDFINYDR